MTKTYTYIDIPQPTNPSASAVDGGSLTQNTTYYYRIIKTVSNTVNWNGKSLPSDSFSATTDTTNKTIRITFTCPNTNHSYKIFRSTTLDGFDGIYQGPLNFYPTDSVYNSDGTVTFDDDGSYAFAGNQFYESNDLAHGVLQLNGSSSSEPFSIIDLYNDDIANSRGIVQRLDVNTYIIKAFLELNANQYWDDVEKTIILADGMRNCGRWTLGRIIGANRTFGGCNIIVKSCWLSSPTVFTGLTAYRTTFSYIYPKTSAGNDIATGLGLVSGSFSGHIQDCTVDRWRGFSPSNASTVVNCIYSRFDVGVGTSQATFNGFKCLSGSRVWQVSGGNINITGRGIYTENTSIILIIGTNETTSLTIIDSITDGGVIVLGTTDQTGFMLYDKLSYNLNVVDEDGNPIEEASLKVYDKNDLLIIDVVTNANGDIPEQYITRRDRGVINTTLQPFVEYNPFTVFISKDGFETYKEIISYTVSNPVVKTIALKKSIPVMLSPQGPSLKLNRENIGEGRELEVKI